MKPTLFVLAAGMGSRYGGLKQLDGLGPNGETIMEASVGVENILKILRIDYYRRLTYLDNPSIKKHGIRIALRFSF